MYKGIQTSINGNRSKSVFLMILFPAFLYAMLAIVFAILLFRNQQAWWTFSDAWAEWLYITNNTFIRLWPVILIRWIISFLFYRQIIFKFSGAKPITRKENPEIYNIVENLCISKWLITPRIGIINDNSMNAFATGRRPKNSWIVFSKWLINRLEPKEIEAVAAHELTHIINKDSLMMMIIVVFIGIIWTLGQILIRVGWGRSNRNSKWGNMLPLIWLILLILGYLIYPLIKLALSRKREYLADAGSVYLTKDKYAMISALQKISGDSQIESIQKDTIAAMCIENPFKKWNKMWFFSKMLATHPSIEDRIKALESY